MSNEIHATGSQIMRDFAGAIGKTIFGYPVQVEMAVVTVVSGGDLLLIGAPGTGKTKLIKRIAQIIAAPYKRVTFTPDLMPSDLLGTEVLMTNRETGQNEFVFRPGPIFHTIFHGDEINRAVPRTQSALLEAMEERQVSLSGVTSQTIQLPRGFTLMATQNPYDRRGTYELPAAQLDRFPVQLVFDRLQKDTHRNVLKATFGNRHDMTGEDRDSLSINALFELRMQAASVKVDDRAIEYVNSLLYAACPDDSSCPESLRKVLAPAGLSTRAGQWILKLAQTRAFMHGTGYVSVDDIRFVLPHVLRHRLQLTDQAVYKGEWNADRAVDTLVKSVTYR
jgi:MoxR-like ATPase